MNPKVDWFIAIFFLNINWVCYSLNLKPTVSCPCLFCLKMKKNDKGAHVVVKLVKMKRQSRLYGTTSDNGVKQGTLVKESKLQLWKWYYKELRGTTNCVRHKIYKEINMYRRVRVRKQDRHTREKSHTTFSKPAMPC